MTSQVNSDKAARGNLQTCCSAASLPPELAASTLLPVPHHQDLQRHLQYKEKQLIL